MSQACGKVPALTAALILLSGIAHGAITLTPSTLNRISTAGALGSSANALQVGDSSVAGSLFVGVFNFTISTSTTDIAAATQITFSLTPTAETGTGPAVRLIAFTADDNTVSAADYSAAGTEVSSFTRTQIQAAITAGSPLVFDVTSIVKADALAGNFTSFRLESTEAEKAGANVFIFGTVGSNDAALNIIPEPSTGLLALASAAFLFQRRRKI